MIFQIIKSTIECKRANYINIYFKELDDKKRNKIISKMSKYVKLKELKIKTESKRKVRAKIYLIKKQDNKLIYYETFKNNTTIQLPDTNYEIELSKKISFFKRKKEKIIIELNKNKEIFI